MKQIYRPLLLVLMLLLGVGCTKYNLIDTGLSVGKHDCSMYDYFKKQPYDWSLTLQMIDRAGLQDLFMGKSTTKQITFLGITNHSIRRYLLQNELASVQEMSVEECRAFILNSVIPQRFMLEEVAVGRKTNKIPGEGGQTMKTMSGTTLWIYTFRDPYNGVPNAGPISIYVGSPKTQKTVKVASSDIQTETGVVHALDYNFNLNDFDE